MGASGIKWGIVAVTREAEAPQVLPVPLTTTCGRRKAFFLANEIPNRVRDLNLYPSPLFFPFGVSHFPIFFSFPPKIPLSLAQEISPHQRAISTEAAPRQFFHRPSPQRLEQLAQVLSTARF